jgi:hypothetical protein
MLAATQIHAIEPNTKVNCTAAKVVVGFQDSGIESKVEQILMAEKTMIVDGNEMRFFRGGVDGLILSADILGPQSMSGLILKKNPEDNSEQMFIANSEARPLTVNYRYQTTTHFIDYRITCR